jgi:hypothetical protein
LLKRIEPDALASTGSIRLNHNNRLNV